LYPYGQESLAFKFVDYEPSKSLVFASTLGLEFDDLRKTGNLSNSSEYDEEPKALFK
jgi:hypothetical protein